MYGWRARIGVKGEDIHLGYFDTKEKAIKAKVKAEEKYKTTKVSTEN